MKRHNSIKVFACLIVFLMALSLFACVAPPPDNTGGGSDQGGTGQGGTGQGGANQDGTNQDGTNQDGAEDPNLIQLIKNNQANFRMIYTSGAGSTNIKAVGNLVVTLRERGVNIEDAVSDAATDHISDCEIIVGANARGRGDACNVSDKTLGLGGYTVKIVGKRIVIAGGTNELTKEAFDIFVSEVFGIGDTATEKPLSDLTINKGYTLHKVTEYDVTSVRIAGNDLKNYILLIDVDSMYGGSNSISAFRQRLYETTGYWLQKGNPEVPEAYKYKLIIRYVEDAGEDGFRAFVSGTDLIFECAYDNAFDKAFGEIVEERIYSVKGVANFPSSYYETKQVSRVYYKDFGAKGDGVTNDFAAILEAHQYANTGGQKVYAEEGAIYNVGDNLYTTINIRTDVDFRGATFVINDVGSAAYATRKTPLFTLARDLGTTESHNMKGVTKFGENIKVSYGDTKLPWLAGHLTGPALIKIENSNHKDFIRHGANQNGGAYRMDMLVVDVDGNISPDTPVGFDYDELTYMTIYYTDCKPITVENASFINICCRVLEETEMKNLFHEYRRNFLIQRPNVTVRNMTHRMEGEPALNWETGAFGIYGDCSESYPYYGFFIFDYAYNSLIEDCDLTGHTVYYEDKPATTSTGGVKPNPVPMGTYDFVIERSAGITLRRVTQYNASVNTLENPEEALADSRYWGIMSSNGSKDLYFEGCRINRFDAHRGFWNATLKDTVIGHTINVIGGGTFNLIGVTKMTGSAFIALRGDYGATFRGDMNIVDCYHQCIGGFNTNKGATGSAGAGNTTYIINSGFSNSASTAEGSYWYWDFGYTCYMPENIVIDNFRSDAKKNVYIFNNLPNTVFGANNSATGEPITNVYQITKSIKLKNISTENNMARIKVCASTASSYSMLRSIPIEKSYKEE